MRTASRLIQENSCSIPPCVLSSSSWMFDKHLKPVKLQSELGDPQFYPCSRILLFYFHGRLLLSSRFRAENLSLILDVLSHRPHLTHRLPFRTHWETCHRSQPHSKVHDEGPLLITLPPGDWQLASSRQVFTEGLWEKTAQHSAQVHTAWASQLSRDKHGRSWGCPQDNLFFTEYLKEALVHVEPSDS